MHNRRRSVLVAENDRAIAQGLRFQLERAGFTVLVAHDGEQAAILAARQRFELMVLNFELPVMDGAALCRHVREDLRLTEVPIVVCAGPNSNADAEFLSYTYGVSQVFCKPVDAASIVEFARDRMKYLVPVR